jgi:hypothetical protein
VSFNENELRKAEQSNANGTCYHCGIPGSMVREDIGSPCDSLYVNVCNGPCWPTAKERTPTMNPFMQEFKDLF